MTGCAAFATPTPETISLLEAVPRVDNSPRAPCWQQRQIAAQNAFLDAALKARGLTSLVPKPLTYKAPCDIDAPKVAGTKEKDKRT